MRRSIPFILATCLASGVLAGCVSPTPHVSAMMAQYDPSRPLPGPTEQQLRDGPPAEWRNMSPECQRLTMAMAPYAQQTRANIAPANASMQELTARSEARAAAAISKGLAWSAAQTAASAASVVPGGSAAGTAVAMAAMQAQAAQFQAWAAEDAPLSAQATQQMNQFVAQSQQMQPDMMRLMAEGQVNHCF